MACYFPLQAYLETLDGPGGRKTRSVFFFEHKPGLEPIKLPCGQCIGCRLRRSRDWTARQVHEASLHSESSFITLTYDDEHLPDDGGLRVRHLQLFFKLLRKRSKVRIRYFACGEYGGLYKRPHYHINVFGYVPSDLVRLPSSRKHPLFRSTEVESCWPHGNCWVGIFSADTASYVAGYVVFKLTGEFSGAYGGLKPEFSTQSRRPGIGKAWFDSFGIDIFKPEFDFIILKGHKVRPPKYYDRLFDSLSPEAMEILKESRIPVDSKVRVEFGADRLRVRYQVAKSRTSRFNREEL